MNFVQKFFKGDKYIWMIFGCLCVISLIEVYSASISLIYQDGNHWSLIVKHALFLLIAVGVVIAMQSINYRYFTVFAVVLLPVSLVLLGVTLFQDRAINDASRWLNIMGIQFQPSELAKLCIIVYVAFVLGKMQDEEGAKNGAFFLVLGALGAFVLLVASENLSTAVMVGGITFAMMIIGRISWSRLFYLFIVIVAALAIVVLFSDRSETWMNRVKSFGKQEMRADNTYQIEDDNRQISYSKMAISNGMIIPKGPGNSEIAPIMSQAYNDFIFAIVIEELGIYGGLLVLFLYMWLLYRVGIMAARIANNKGKRAYPTLLIIGCGLMITSQALVNMAVAVNLIPVTGQPLPLISKGGTSIIITGIYFGIILSVSNFANQAVEEKRKKSVLGEKVTASVQKFVETLEED